VLQRDRKVVLSDWFTEEYLEEIDEAFYYMARKGIVNVVGAGISFDGDDGADLDTNTWSPMVTQDPEDGRGALPELRDGSVVLLSAVGAHLRLVP
jgi:hypothetical protein